MPRKQEFTLDVSGGLVTLLSPRSLQPNQCPIFTNFDPSLSYSKAVSRKGRSVFIPALGAPTGSPARVNGFYEFVLSSGTTIYVVQEGTKVYTATVGGSYTDKTGTLVLTHTRTSFAELNDILFMANAGDGLAQYDGGAGNFTELADANRPVGSGLLVKWNGKLFSTNGASLLRWSKTSDGTDWTTALDAGSLDINPGDGSAIVALVPGKNAMLICKNHSILEWTGRTAAEFGFTELLDEGLVHERAWATWKGLPIVGTPSGIWIAGSQLDRETELSFLIRDVWRDTIAQSSYVALHVNKHRLFVVYDDSGNGVADTAYVLDIPTGKWSKWTGQPYSFMYNAQDGTLLAGSMDARVAMLKLLDTYQDEGTNITVTLRTKAFMASALPFMRGSFDEVRALVRRTTGARTMDVKLLTNDLTSTTLLTATDVQNATGEDLYFVEAGTKLSGDVISAAVELESAGNGKFELHGVSLYGDRAEEP